MKRTGKQSAIVVEKAVKELNSKLKPFMSKELREYILNSVAFKYDVPARHIKRVAAMS